VARAWRALLGTLDGEGLLKWEETFLDGSFASAKKGAPQSVKPSVARDEVDGTGRRRRSSAGSSAEKCLSGRSHAPRASAPQGEKDIEVKAEASDR